MVPTSLLQPLLVHINGGLCVTFSTCHFTCLLLVVPFFQYVHYEVDYSDVELNKEEKGKEKKKDEKV